MTIALLLAKGKSSAQIADFLERVGMYFQAGPVGYDL